MPCPKPRSVGRGLVPRRAAAGDKPPSYRNYRTPKSVLQPGPLV
jgi:hypothetical protein